MSAPTQKYVNSLENLQNKFRKHFNNIRQLETLFKIIENPFYIDENEIPEEYQLEVIDLKANSSFRDLYRESTLIEFYNILDSKKFLKIKKLA